MRYVPLASLEGGEILAVNIINANMQILIREGSELTSKMINRIDKLGISSLYIKELEMGKYYKESISDSINTTLRNNSVNGIKNCFERFEDRVNKQKKSLKYGDSGSELISAIKTISKDLIDEILNAKNTEISMIDIKNLSDYNYKHSVNVAVLSLIIGTELGLTTKELEDLVYGALLIDIGCNWIDNDILQKQAELSESELKTVQSHVGIGYDYISNNTIFDAHNKSIIMHHHERNDGSGYPKGLKEADIHPLAKIVMIADVYDALTSDRPHRVAFNQHEAMEFIMARAGSLFDFKIASVFLKKIIPYPIGTYVLLSNGQKAVVIENNSDHPLRPIIRTFGKSNYTSESSFQIDLLEVNNITIQKIIYSLS